MDEASLNLCHINVNTIILERNYTDFDMHEFKLFFFIHALRISSCVLVSNERRPEMPLMKKHNPFD